MKRVGEMHRRDGKPDGKSRRPGLRAGNGEHDQRRPAPRSGARRPKPAAARAALPASPSPARSRSRTGSRPAERSRAPTAIASTAMATAPPAAPNRIAVTERPLIIAGRRCQSRAKTMIRSIHRITVCFGTMLKRKRAATSRPPPAIPCSSDRPYLTFAVQGQVERQLADEGRRRTISTAGRPD